MRNQSNLPGCNYSDILNYSYVRKTFFSYDITSPKVFQGKLRCANLTTKYLDHIEVSEAITSKSTTMLGNKTFDNLVVKGDLVSDRIVTNYINGVNLSALLEKAVFVNRPQEFESMQFDNIKGT